MLLVYESTDGKPGFMAESLFRTEQNIAMKITPDYAKQSGVKVIVQSVEVSTKTQVGNSLLLAGL